MSDPTYIKDVIDANPAWKLAFELSEVDNDSAPIGWFDYIHIASHLLTNYELKKIPDKSSMPENLKCPDCGGDMISRTGKFGTFWGCRTYPKCRGTRDEMGRSKDEARAERDKERDSEVRQDDKYRFRRS